MTVTAGISCIANGRQITCRYPDDLFAPAKSVRASISDGGLQFETQVEYSTPCSLWRRTDYVTNTTSEVIHLESLSSVLEIPAEHPQLTIMRSQWSREAQEERADCSAESLSIESPGRSCYNFRPYARIESPALGKLIINLLPVGDWRMTFDCTNRSGPMTVEIGHPEDKWALDLQPGQRYRMAVSSVLQFVEPGDDRPIGHFVQSYALDSLSRRPKRALPVVYNNWFDRFHRISWESLTTQLDVAAEIGCETFVVNAGWFGPTREDWGSVGDWRENTVVFREHSLGEFADLVRSKGLGFGLWMEPERVKGDTPIYGEHPDWFIQAGGWYYPNLLNPSAREWTMFEMVRLVETYDLQWFTIDCNQNFSRDPENRAHELRIEALYQMLDELAARFPDLFVEGCASGGTRADLLNVSHYDTHFLSDTVDPVDVIRIGMSVASSLSPRMTSKWAIIYPTNRGWTRYDREAFDTGDLVLSPSNGKADKVSSYELEFVVRAAMTGVMGIGGNVAGLEDELRRKLTEHIRFYKKHRDFIQDSIAIPITPVESIDKRNGVSAMQLSNRDFSRSMLFLYNIASRLRSVKVAPFYLDETTHYDVLNEQGEKISSSSGSELMSGGLEVECGSGHARILIVQRL